MTQKRKAEFGHGHSKKPRTENGKHDSSKQEPIRQTTSSHPQLPSINPELEKAVFTHQSAAGPRAHTQELTYERLEFLGDAYIEGMATRLIWSLFKTMPAGRMSQTRELLVKNETLYEYALLYDFNKRIIAAQNQHWGTENPKQWLKVVADVFEAYVAAIILSEPLNGFKIAEEWLVQLWEPKLKHIPAEGPNMKAKEELAKRIMYRGVKLHYKDEAPMEQLKGGMQTYFVGVYLTGWGWEDQHLGSGTGLGKNAAGNEAAARALENRPLIDEIILKRKHELDKLRAQKEMEEANVK